MALGRVLTLALLIATRADPVGPFVFPAYMAGGDQGFVAPYWPPVGDFDEFAIGYSASMRCEKINMSRWRSRLRRHAGYVPAGSPSLAALDPLTSRHSPGAKLLIS